jgi:CDP-diacylglycerol--glycerol-3-phosphate 3-phosphatidyltransferase
MMSSTERVEHKQRVREQRQRGQWESLTDWARAQAGFILVPIARVMGRLGVHPNTVTILGLLLQAGVGILFGLGYTAVGGWLLLIVAPVDALDGAVARVVGKQSSFGAFLDSTLDRLADAGLILGLTAYYLGQEASTEVVLLLISLVAVMMVSYTRARAESLGFPCKVGLLTRMERILLIGGMLVIGLPTAMTWALAVLSVFTAAQRILHVYVVSRQQEQDS